MSVPGDRSGRADGGGDEMSTSKAMARPCSSQEQYEHCLHGSGVDWSRGRGAGSQGSDLVSPRGLDHCVTWAAALGHCHSGRGASRIHPSLLSSHLDRSLSHSWLPIALSAPTPVLLLAPVPGLHGSTGPRLHRTRLHRPLSPLSLSAPSPGSRGHDTGSDPGHPTTGHR